MDDQALNTNRIYTDMEWALSQGHPASDLVFMAERLLKSAEPGSMHLNYAKRHLAELLSRSNSFRAARLAREVIEDDPTDDRAFAALGLAYLSLGHFKMAEQAYRMALCLLPHCPWYAHNLGHLLDVALGQPAAALPFLALSRRALPDDGEIARSYSHALAALGEHEEALIHLIAATDGNQLRAREILDSWDCVQDAKTE